MGNSIARSTLYTNMLKNSMQSKYTCHVPVIHSLELDVFQASIVIDPISFLTYNVKFSVE